MWYSRIVFPLILGASLPACAAPVSCPVEIKISGVAHPLNNANVFDGPPAELASLEAVNGVWDTKIADSATGKYYLVCDYAGTSVQTTIPLSPGITSCELDGTQQTPQINCH